MNEPAQELTIHTRETEKLPLRKSALLVILNKEGKVLLQHKDGDAPNWPNKWCLFGGGVKPGEEPEMAAEREMDEELGWKVSDYEEFATEASGGIERHVFTAHTEESVEELRKKQMEGDDLCFFSEYELDTIDTAPPHLTFIRAYFEQAKHSDT